MRKFDIIPGFEYTKTDYADYVTSLSGTGCTVTNLGASSDSDYDIYSLSLGTLNNKKPIVYIQGQIHGGHEWRTAFWVRKFMELLANPPNTTYGDILKKLRYYFDFYCIPLLNPWGYVNNDYENRNGVSISRNFDYNWSNGGQGSAAWSEPEAVIVRDIVLQYKPLTLLCCHTLGSSEQGFAIRPPQNSFYRHTFVDIIGRLEMLLSLGLGHTGEVSGTMSEPSAYNWARTLESDAGRQIYCCALETGGGETELEQSRMGLNGLLLLSLGAYNAFKWKRLDSNCSL